LKGEKGDFADYSFKEGSTQTAKLQDIFIQEKGKDALKKLETSASAAAPKVVGGAKRKKKQASKGSKKGKGAKKSQEKPEEIRKSVESVVKYTPSKSKQQATPSKVKPSAKKSVGKKKTPAMASPGDKQTPRTTDMNTMKQFQKYLKW